MANLKILILCLCLLILCAVADGKSLAKKIPSQEVSNSTLLNARGFREISQNPFRVVKIFIKKLFGMKTIIVDYNSRPFIDTITLNKTHITTGCQNKDSSLKSGLENAQMVEATIHAADPDGDSILYYYQITAGKIIGSGTRVIWDLSGVSPGTYQIKVCADDGCGLCEKPVVMEINVVERTDC